jgi:hypothetical protein
VTDRPPWERNAGRFDTPSSTIPRPAPPTGTLADARRDMQARSDAAEFERLSGLRAAIVIVDDLDLAAPPRPPAKRYDEKPGRRVRKKPENP